MSELKTEVLKYKGKTLKREGTTNGKEWKIWKLSFESGGTYDWNVSAFDNISDKGVTPKDMEEGKYYEVVYKINEFTGTHGLTKSKNAVLIKESTEDKSTQNNLGRKEETSTTSTSLPIKDWDTFKEGYDKGMEGKSEKGSMHMLGAYMCNYYSDECSDIIEKIKEHFK